MPETMYIHVCEAYLNTNYLTVEDCVEIFGYWVMETDNYEECLKRFEEIMISVREAWYEDLAKSYENDEEEPDLKLYATVLTRNVEHLIHQLQEELCK